MPTEIYNPVTNRQETLGKLTTLFNGKIFTNRALLEAIADTVATGTKAWPHTDKISHNPGGFVQALIRYCRSEEAIIDEGPDGNAFRLKKGHNGSTRVFIYNDGKGQYYPYKITPNERKEIIGILLSAIDPEHPAPSVFR